MMTASNITRHELIGLKVKASEGSIEGKVIDETRNMLVIESNGTEKKIPKDKSSFSFFLPETGEWVRVEGRLLVARPEDRIKKKQEKW